jgi:hypothetical protein
MIDTYQNGLWPPQLTDQPLGNCLPCPMYFRPAVVLISVALFVRSVRVQYFLTIYILPANPSRL